MRRHIDKAFSLCGILRERRGLHAFTRWRPFSIASYQLLAALQGMGLRFRTIIDAGANVGQFSRASVEIYPEASVLSFEPLPEAALRLKVNLADRPQVHVFETAVGDSDGTISFYPNEYSLASSVLPLKADKPPSFGGLRQLGAITVPVVRLDSVLAGRALPRPSLLKLDLQGFELEALKGARETLTRCDHVLVETAFDADYEGAPSFDNVLAYLHDCDFSFALPLAFLKGADGRIAEMDALFQNNACQQREAETHRDVARGSYQESVRMHASPGYPERR